MMEQVAIRCQGIKKCFGVNETFVEALKGIDLDIERAKLTLLVGPSGSGKTTLLSIITTILKPDAGQLFLLGQEVSRMTKDEKAQFCLHNLGIVFQSLFLIPTLTVAENISLPLLIAGYSHHQAHERALVLLDQMRLRHKAHFSPVTLSKGQQQRVAIARALVNDSQIIVSDEPTSALDHIAGHEIMSLLKELVLNYAKTLLVVTHDHRIFTFADRIIYMNDGQIKLSE